jgi:hypothetical protein
VHGRFELPFIPGELLCKRVIVIQMPEARGGNPDGVTFNPDGELRAFSLEPSGGTGLCVWLW